MYSEIKSRCIHKIVLRTQVKDYFLKGSVLNFLWSLNTFILNGSTAQCTHPNLTLSEVQSHQVGDCCSLLPSLPGCSFCDPPTLQWQQPGSCFKTQASYSRPRPPRLLCAQTQLTSKAAQSCLPSRHLPSSTKTEVHYPLNSANLQIPFSL